MNNIKHLKAFTLLELLVAMGASSLVLMFGIFGVVRLRDSVEHDSSYSDMSSFIRTVSNKAKNSISTPQAQGVPIAPQVYGIRIFPDRLRFELCNNVNSTTVNCTATDEEYVTKNNMSINANCESIGFTKSTTTLLTYESNGNIITSGNCEIILFHSGTGRELTISANFDNNILLFNE